MGPERVVKENIILKESSQNSCQRVQLSPNSFPANQHFLFHNYILPLRFKFKQFDWKKMFSIFYLPCYEISHFYFFIYFSFCNYNTITKTLVLAFLPLLSTNKINKEKERNLFLLPKVKGLFYKKLLYGIRPPHIHN